MYTRGIGHVVISDTEAPDWLIDIARGEKIDLLHVNDPADHRVPHWIRRMDLVLLSTEEINKDVTGLIQMYGEEKNQFALQYAMIDLENRYRPLTEAVVRGYYRMIRNMGDVYRARRMGIRLSQRLSRRDIFRIHKTILRYIDVPLVDHRCINYRACRLCIDACERDAIVRGDGAVEIDVEKCISCGACVISCPHGYILPPFPTPFHIKNFVKGYGVAPRIPVLFIEYKSFYEHGSKLSRVVYDGHPPIILMIPRITQIPLEVLSTLASSNFKIILFNDRHDGFSQKWVEEVKMLFKDSVEETDDIEELPKYYGEKGYSRVESHWRYIQGLRGNMPNDYTLNYLPFFSIEVDVEKCRYCKKCVEACPFRAFSTKDSLEEIEIRFNPLECRGCSICIIKCPERIMSLRRSVEPNVKRWSGLPHHL